MLPHEDLAASELFVRRVVTRTPLFRGSCSSGLTTSLFGAPFLPACRDPAALELFFRRVVTRILLVRGSWSDGGGGRFGVVVVGVDSELVSGWIDAHVDSLVGPCSFEIIGGGRSNLTFLGTDAEGTPFVLRRPPIGAVLATAHDMGREFRVISAVYPTAVPVPVPLGLCENPTVNDAVFYLMEFVDGVVLDAVDKAEPLSSAARAAASDDLVRVLGDLHAVDIDAVGLGDFGRREGYVERQVARWSKQWAGSKTRDITTIDRVAAQLASRVPTQQRVSVVHGDYRFGNVVVDPVTGSIKAVLDWELCTLGDPLADVGYLGVHWAADDGSVNRPNDPTVSGGFGSFADVVDAYAVQTGLDLADIGYYVAFQCWRSAVIIEGVYARFLAGTMGDQQLDDDTLAELRDAPPQLVARAAEALGRGPL